MKTLAVFAVALAGIAPVASADFIPLPPNAAHYSAANISMVAEPIGIGGGADLGAPQYSSIPGPYTPPATASFAHRDDYTSIAAGNFELDGLRFVGGVTTAGMKLDFIFLDNAAIPNVVTGFTITFPQGGNFIWTISFGLPDPVVPNVGHLQVQTSTATDTGRWYFTSTAAAPGSNSFAAGSGSELNPPLIKAFELQIPAPGALALLGVGGVLAARRRR
jgi:hypothetical protein